MGGLLPGLGSIISPTTAMSLDSGGQRGSTPRAFDGAPFKWVLT